MRAELLDHLALITNEEGIDASRPLINVFVVCKLSKEQAASIQVAVKDLYFFTSGEDLYNCYQASMKELLRALMVFARSYFDDDMVIDDVLNKMSFDFSRLLLNLLGMFRSFIDHGSAALSRRFGEDSSELRAWEAAQSKEYDGYASYRFFHNLRNYAQHVGMPPLHFSVDDSAEQEGIAIRLNFHRDELLSSYKKWSKHARVDLQGGPEVIHLLPLLDEWSHCFHRLVKEIQSIRSEAVMASVETILSLRTQFGLPQDGTLAMMREPKVSEEGQLDLGIRNLPELKALEISKGDFLETLKDY